MTYPVRMMLLASFAVFSFHAPKAFADRDPNPQPLERGPLHEAFAMPWQANPGANPAINQTPPEPIREEPPDQIPAGKNVKWIPGYWQFDTEKKDFVWVGGFWREVPDGRRWVPGYWAETSAGNRWVSGHWAAAQEPDYQYVPTPPQNAEAGPSTPAPDSSSVYIPGSWLYSDNGYAYRPGYWTGYRPGYVWVPSTYIWSPLGWIFASGYWDYWWATRGLLYPSLYFGEGFRYGYPGYVYRPNYFLRINPLAGGVYVNPLASHYYYGNYAGSNLRQAGLTSWADYSTGAYDPLFASARVANRGNSQWLANAQGAGGSGMPAFLTATQQLRSSGVQFTQLTSQQRQAQLQSAQQLVLQSQRFSQQASRNFSAGANNFSRGLATSNFSPGFNANSHANFSNGANYIPRMNVPGANFNGLNFANHPSFSTGGSGFARPSFGFSSSSNSSFSNHSSSHSGGPNRH
ncbi:MAG TPA: hypothetical protein VKS79_17155 [Gemmataceae bacterium]|nr:hypothetical protein [Gemmataceae bacterium]